MEIMARLMTLMGIPSSPSLQAFLAVISTLLIAVIIDLALTRIFRRFARFTETDLDDRIIDLLRRPLFVTVMMVGVLISVSYLKPSVQFLFYAEGVLYSAVTLLWSFIIIRICNLVIEFAVSNMSDVTGLRKEIIPLVENLLLIVLLIGALFVILAIWKINLTPLLASAGIAGAIVALAAKDTVANFFGGISIFIDRPFKITDYIVLDGKERGEVVSIGIRSTRIRTRDDSLITIPNSAIANARIINESAPIPRFRIRTPAAVAYGTDIELVQKILLEIAEGNENVIGSPAPRVRFREFGDSALKFELLCWVKEPALRGRTIHEINCAIYKRFNEDGIKIPFPQRDIYLHQEE